MKHIEISKKITLTKKVSSEDFRKALLERLERVVDVDRVTDSSNGFGITGTTGHTASLSRHARLDLDVEANVENDAARIIISGYSRPAWSLVFMYWLFFVVMLLVGLLPGSIETDAAKSGSGDALVFVIFGIYIAYDLGKKIDESRDYLMSALESLNTAFS